MARAIAFRGDGRTAIEGRAGRRFLDDGLPQTALLRPPLRHHALPAMIGAPRAARTTSEGKSWQAELVSVH